MSHNVKLKDLAFTDISILRAAVKELAKEGAPITWAEGPGTKMRGAFSGMDRYAEQDVDAVIKIADGNTGSYGNWDVGFKWDAEAKKYETITDSDLAVHGQKLGLGSGPESKTISGDFCRTDTSSRMLGRLSQRYNIIRDEITAARSGMITKRIVSTDGVMMLEAEAK